MLLFSYIKLIDVKMKHLRRKHMQNLHKNIIFVEQQVFFFISSETYYINEDSRVYILVVKERGMKK